MGRNPLAHPGQDVRARADDRRRLAARVPRAAAHTDGPATVLMFRSRGEELGALRNARDPFFAPVWRDDEVGMLIDERTDRTEVTELLTESYCALAPKALAREVTERAGS